MLLIKNGKVLTMGPQGVLEQADAVSYTHLDVYKRQQLNSGQT